MARVRYQVDGLPQGANAHAFLPMPGTSAAGSSHGEVDVYGAWGTMPVPAPHPASSPHLHRDQRTPSDVAPDYFLPQIGIAGTRNMRPPVHYLPQAAKHRIPAPIGSVMVQPSPVLQRGRKKGGRYSMIWPRTITRWPNLLHRGQGATGGN